MATASLKQDISTSTPPVDWLERLRANLDEHTFFWIMLLIALYVFFGVPQVTNVWQQRPPLEGDPQSMVGYLIFLSFLIGFYALSLFVVIRRFPSRWVQDRVEVFVSRRMEQWHEQGRRRFYRPSYYFAVVTWRAPDLCCRWLVWTVSNPACRKDVPKVAVSLLVAFLVGSTGLLLGTRSDASRVYPLAGAFCQHMAFLSLAATVWLMAAIPPRIGGAERPRKVWLYFGRFIAWLLATALVGELLWVLACTNWRDNLISYRLYTIWAVFQLLTTLVIAGLLIDRWHQSTKRWPIRQLALLLLPGLVWGFSRSLPVDALELDRHLSRDQIPAWKTLRTSAALPVLGTSTVGLMGYALQEGPFLAASTLFPGRATGADGANSVAWHARSNGKWFAYLNSRVQAIPESQPVILVAASGGGSRAAIFTALVLETLARTPTTKDPLAGQVTPILNDPVGAKQRTWADNVVLISSVSGGSLATAYHVAGRVPPTPLAQQPGSPPSHQPGLLNTAPLELQHWGVGYAGELIQAYLDAPPEGFPVEMFRGYYEKPNRTRKDAAVAVQALQQASPALRTLHENVAEERELKQAALTQLIGLPRAHREALAQDVVQLNETAVALRTALALLDGYTSLKDPAAAPLGPWIWTSRAFDEMCVDFMAPLTRGVLTPLLDRGDALARFWTHRFGWSNCTNFSGYHGPLTEWNYGLDRPAVLFNAVDVARGSRLAVGFPPLPSDLWDAVYQSGLTREAPRALNAPVSLARAVRMSSNFPYGFRAMEFQVPTQLTRDPTAALKPSGSAPRLEFDRVHVLDGGVVDNTGLDTLFELLLAVEYHADPKNGSMAYQADAADLLANLRRHGVCVLEIDAGAKPTTKLPAPINPFGGITEQNQALENGAYSNGDRAKQLYLKEIRRILTQRLEESVHPVRTDKTSSRDLEERLPPTALHYCFQCNHYQPGHGADPAIMTAWALGPRDKAEVVARFLPELGVWDRRRSQLWDDIRAGKDGVARAREVVRLRRVLDRVTALSLEFHRLSHTLADLEQPARAGSPVPADQLAQLRRKFDEAKAQLAPLTADVGRETDPDLRAVWREFGQQVHEDDERLALLEKAQTAAQPEWLKAELQRKPDRARQSQEFYHQVDARLQATKASVEGEVTAELDQARLLDPQLKYDQQNRQNKEVYDKRSAAER